MIDRIIEWMESNKWGKKVMYEITKRIIREFATWKGQNNFLGIKMTPESVQFGLEEVEDWLRSEQ